MREIQWGTDPSLIKLHGGSMRPGIPPSIFNVPASCVPSPKPAPRPAKVDDQHLRSYTQSDETVRLAMNYDIPFDKTIQNVVTLQAHTSAYVDTKKEKKLVFLTRQLELLSQKQFSMNDYCFSLQSYPMYNYEQLRYFLLLPCKRKLQYITSSVDKDQVLRETFDKVRTLQQKNVFLLVDKVHIRPAVSFPGGLLNGMVENNRDFKTTSILCVMMKSLHKGPSPLISDTRPQADGSIPA
ncbi:hypothetical protein FHG87_001384 [Trinorchestia longiramus]|nr:hypothetical protein FHG87_001384 [Trinorchestia longiramus]